MREWRTGFRPRKRGRGVQRQSGRAFSRQRLRQHGGRNESHPGDTGDVCRDLRPGGWGTVALYGTPGRSGRHKLFDLYNTESARESRKTPGFTERSLPGRYEPVGSGGSRQPQRNNVLASRRNLMSYRSLRRAQRAAKHSCRRADGRLIRGQCLRRARAASARFCSRSTRRVEADPLNQNVFSVRKNPSALVGGKVNAKRCSKDELDFLYEGTRGLVQGELHFFREQFLLGRGLSVDPDESFGAMGPRRAL